MLFPPNRFITNSDVKNQDLVSFTNPMFMETKFIIFLLLSFHMTQLLNKNNTESHRTIRSQMSVEIRVNENTMAKEMNGVRIGEGPWWSRFHPSHDLIYHNMSNAQNFKKYFFSNNSKIACKLLPPNVFFPQHCDVLFSHQLKCFTANIS